MKTFKKVLASTLAAAMVVTALPVTPANAAAAPKLSATKATLYVGQSKAITVKAIPSTWKSAKVTAKSSKKSVATVKTSKKKVTVKAVKAGTAKVTVEVTGKKSGKKVSKSLKATITVKNPSLTLKAANEVAVGAKETVKATVKPASTKVVFSSSDETIATVDAATGEVTGVKAGEVTITAKAGKTTKTVKMAVKNYIISSLKQTKADTFEASILGKTSNIKAADITFTSKDNNVVYPVKSVSVDKADATKVTITVFSALKDGKTYVAKLDGQEQEIVVSDGKIASVTVDPTTIPYGVATEISLIAKDAQGIELEKAAYPGDASKYDFKITTNNAGAYTDGSKLYLAKKGDTATAEVTYKSGKYDANGKPEGNVESGKVTITAVDQAAVNNFEVRYNANQTDKFDKVKTDNKVAAGDTVYAYFKIKDANNKDANYADYKVSSTDNSVLMLAADSIDTTHNNTIQVVPVKEGTAYLLVKKGNDVVYSTAVTVVAGRTVSSMAIDKTSVTLTNSTSLNKTDKVTATFKDQFGADKNIASTDIDVSCVNTTAKKADGTALPLADITAVNKYYSVNVPANSNKAEVTFGGTDGNTVDSVAIAEGTYTYKIAYKKDGKELFARTVTVIIQKPDTTKTTSSLALNISEKTVDEKVANDAINANKDITISVSELLGGIAYKDLTASGYTLKDGSDVKSITYNIEKDGKTIGSDATTGTRTFNVVSFDPSGLATKAATGTYKVKATIVTKKGSEAAVTKTLIDTFEVKDTQADGTISLEQNTVTASNVENMVKAAVKYVYGDYIYGAVNGATGALDVTKVEGVTNTGVKIGDGTNGTTVASGVTLTAGQTVSITKITVKVQVGTGLYVTKDVPVNYVITAK